MIFPDQQADERAMRNVNDLSVQELLALAIALEEEDERIYADFAQGLRPNFPESAAVFEEMRAEESGHRRRLQEMFQQKFGEHIPLIRRQDVKGFVARRDLTGVFCTSGSEREFTLEGSWYADEKYKPEQIVTLLRQIEVGSPTERPPRKPARKPKSLHRPTTAGGRNSAG